MMRIVGLLLLFTLAACDSFPAAPYGVSPDNSLALKSIPASEHVNVGAFTVTQTFNSTCRLAGPIRLPGGLSFEGYIQKAFSDELKVAGVYDDKSPVTLHGVVTDMEFSSNSGYWDIALTVNSSNGNSVAVSERYDFDASFISVGACHNVAAAYQSAVQELINKVITAPTFRSLLRK